MFWAEIYKISEFLSENFYLFIFVVKFSIYLNTRVFVMFLFRVEPFHQAKQFWQSCLPWKCTPAGIQHRNNVKLTPRRWKRRIDVVSTLCARWDIHFSSFSYFSRKTGWMLKCQTLFSANLSSAEFAFSVQLIFGRRQIFLFSRK